MWRAECARNRGLCLMKQRNPGSVLVTLQFGILFVLLWWVVWNLRLAALPPSTWLLWGGGTLLGVWALAANRPGNFNIRPVPKPDGQLVEHGPYRWIRHPMYSAVLLLAAGCATFLSALLGWVLVLLLAGVLAAKAALEERLMRELHPGYAPYCSRTRRFIPYLY
ncbi:MAG: hypothetical protein RJA36_967 [Pseudomonadota bacterium]|jgi:protein-S-isoprenylcysteine O-methyltransferase Ste14